MLKRAFVCIGLFVLAATMAHVRAAPVTPAVFSRIAGALARGDGVQARQLADAALAGTEISDADHDRLLLDRGRAKQLTNDPNGALADLTQAINAHHALTAPERAQALVERGLLLDSMNRLNDAIGDYSAALQIDPNAPAALNNRANVWRRQNRLGEARQGYLASLAAGNPRPEYSLYGLGQIAEREGKTDEARGFYARAVAADPGYALASARLAALGGVPEGIGAGAERIVLHPPGRTGQDGFTPASAPVVLKPPAGAGPIHLRAPHVMAAAAHPDPEHVKLRPALDDRGGKAHKNAPGGQAQLGAWRSATEARQGWTLAVKRAAGALDGFSPNIVVADLPGRGRYYRLRVELPPGSAAAGLCATLIAGGQACIPVYD